MLHSFSCRCCSWQLAQSKSDLQSRVLSNPSKNDLTYLRGKSFQCRATFPKKIVWHYFSIFVPLISGQNIGKNKIKSKNLSIFTYVPYYTFFYSHFCFQIPQILNKDVFQNWKDSMPLFFSRIQRRKELDVKNWTSSRYLSYNVP